MDTQHLDQIRFVARHYQDLQGLRNLVPTGLCAIGIGVSFLRPASLLDPRAFVVSIAEFFLCLAIGVGGLRLWLSAKSYYRRAFGEVERRPVSQVLLNSVVELGVTVVLFYLAFRAVVSFGTVRSTFIAYGSWLLGRWVWMEGRLSQAHYLVLGALLVGIGAPGPLSAFFRTDLASRGIAQILCGTALVLAGLVDHQQLVRIMGQLPAPSRESEAAASTEVER